MQLQTSHSESVPFVQEEVALPTEISARVEMRLIAEDANVKYEASTIIAYLSISVQPVCVIFSPVISIRDFIFKFSRLSPPAQNSTGLTCAAWSINLVVIAAR